MVPTRKGIGDLRDLFGTRTRAGTPFSTDGERFVLHWAHRFREDLDCAGRVIGLGWDRSRDAPVPTALKRILSELGAEDFVAFSRAIRDVSLAEGELCEDPIERAFALEAAAFVSPCGLAKLLDQRWIFARHLRAVDDALLWLLAGEYDQLVVSMPPRHGKSTVVSQTLPVWFILHSPDLSVISSNYSGLLAERFGRRCRDRLEWIGPRFGVHVRRDVRAKDRWETEFGGGMISRGVGGSITGEGADLLLVDDPIKGHEQALSTAQREHAWEWMTADAETRLQPGAKSIVVQTRWHEDDPAGRIEAGIRSGSRPRSRIFSLPAIAEERDELGRAKGEALFPELYPVEWLESRRRSTTGEETRLGPYWWDALYQQRPTPQAGGIFKREWFRYYELKGDLILADLERASTSLGDCYQVITVDLAVSTKESADYTCVSVWAVSSRRAAYLLSWFRERVEGPEQEKMIATLARRYAARRVYIESNQYQETLAQRLRREGIPAQGIASSRDKVTRSMAFAARLEAGTCFFPRVAGMEELERELLSFPNGSHDDFVDTCSLLAGVLLESPGHTSTDFLL